MKMTCKLCKTKPVWQFTNKRQLCALCFARYFEAKVRKTIRKYQMPIYIIRKNNLKSQIINNIIENLPKRAGKLSDESLSDISNKVLYILMCQDWKKLRKLLSRNQPLYFLSDAEIELYAKLTGIKGKLEKRKGKMKEVDDFLKIFEKKNPDIRHNIVQALLRLRI